MIRLLCACCVFWLLLVPGPALALAPRVFGAVVIRDGLFEAGKASSAGHVEGVMEVVQIARGPRVPRVDGAGLGMVAMLRGMPEGVRANVTVRIVPPGGPVSHPGRPHLQWTMWPRTGHPFYCGWLLDEQSPPGRWTVQLFVAGKLEAERVFELTPENRAGPATPENLVIRVP